MSSTLLQRWDGQGVFLLQLDYGYDTVEITGNRRSRETLSLDFGPVGDLGQRLSPEVRVLTGADRLLGLARRRGGENWAELIAKPDRQGLLLVYRFPRSAPKLTQPLRTHGLFAGSATGDATGELPPLYRRVGVESELGRLHLAFEWETGLAAARGASVLNEAAGLMAAAGELSPVRLSSHLGTSSGAARSYLSWMVEAGLARRTAHGYALRHGGLAHLFGGGKEPLDIPSPAPVPAPPPSVPDAEPLSQSLPPFSTSTNPPPKPAPRRWDPSEMD